MLLFLSCFVFVQFLIPVLCGSKIVNGTDASNGEYPFAAILKSNNSLTCGSTILNENYVLTAAHCVCFNGNHSFDPSYFSVQYGLTKIADENRNTVKVAKIYCNKYNPIGSVTYDSAILKLESPLPNDGSWEQVQLAKNFKTETEQSGTIIGWGRLAHQGRISETLQKLHVNIYDDDTCGKKYDNNHHICFGAMNGGACNGDSGTALLVNGVQVGIASFITNICGIANKEFPNVYSRIPTYFGWIQSITKDVLFTEVDSKDCSQACHWLT